MAPPDSHHPQKRLLHELLQDDQEPFLLLRRQTVRNPAASVARKRNPISHHQHIIPHNNKSSRTSCFGGGAVASPAFSAVKQSPFGIRSPLTATPKTASFLLEAALRISRNGNGNRGCRIFGSLLKRLTNGGRKKSNKSKKNVKECSVRRMSPFRDGGSGPSWTESSSSLSDDDDDDEEFVNEMFEFASYEEKRYCESPFHFVLQRSPPPDGCRTPDFSSPAASPVRLITENNNKDGESLKKCQIQKQQEADADVDADDVEEKEQCSPVSVLDPPFVDDDEDDDDRTVDDGFDNLDCSFAFVQRAKHQLLHKLRRFEKLAELDPIELEKLMLDHDGEISDGIRDRKRSDIDEFVMDEVSASRSKVPRDIKMLVSDLIDEEEYYLQETHQGNNVVDREVVAKRVCKRFESWKEVESNTIEMMVEQDFDRSQGEWRGRQDEMSGIAIDIEGVIFGLLVEELSDEFEF
ncbi:hypothetical protein LINPERPRIM_LOCUS27210 [Linum perenne]